MLNNKIKSLTKSEMLRNLTVLTGGTIFAQAIPIAISPILSRLYSPEDFGVWALYISFVSFLSVLSTGRYQFAIMLPKNDDDAVNILGLSFSILLIFCVLLELLIVLLFDVFQQFEAIKKIEFWIYFLPISIFLVSSISILNTWNTRKKKFKNIVFSKVGQTTTTSIVNVGVGISKNEIKLENLPAFLIDTPKNLESVKASKLGIKGLIGGTIIGQLIGLLALSYNFFKYSFQSVKSIDKSKFKWTVRKYKDFPTINTFHALIDNIQSSGVSLMVVYFFNAHVLGLYSYAYRMIQSPLGMITSSYSQVFFQRSAELNANGEKVFPLFKKTLKIFILIGLPIFFVLGVFAQDIFAFVFGDEWRESGTYVQILAPWFFMNFLLSPMGQIPIILNKQKEVFLYSIIGNILILLSISIGGFFFNSALVSFGLVSFTQVIYYGYMLLWFSKITKK